MGAELGRFGCPTQALCLWGAGMLRWFGQLAIGDAHKSQPHQGLKGSYKECGEQGNSGEAGEVLTDL